MKQTNLQKAQARLREKFIKNGVKMPAPETVYFSKDTKIGKNVTIEPYVVLGEKVKIQNKTGVDPNNGGTHRMTSDTFFSKNENKFDLIFIDGLHIYSQVLKDIHNSLNCLKENGFILLHDCFPFGYYDQAIPRAQKKWNGDVWKAIVEMRTLNYVDTYVGAFDNGIGLVIKRKNKRILNKPSKPFNKIKYQEYYENYEEFLNLVSKEKFFKIINEHK